MRLSGDCVYPNHSISHTRAFGERTTHRTTFGGPLEVEDQSLFGALLPPAPKTLALTLWQHRLPLLMCQASSCCAGPIGWCRSFENLYNPRNPAYGMSASDRWPLYFAYTFMSKYGPSTIPKQSSSMDGMGFGGLPPRSSVKGTSSNGAGYPGILSVVSLATPSPGKRLRRCTICKRMSHSG